MPKIEKILTIDITPENYLNNCSPEELKEIDILLKSNRFQHRMNSQVCRVCGCSDYDCSQCIERTGEACSWFEDDLCSACANSMTQITNETSRS